jgi:hypothetical protein
MYFRVAVEKLLASLAESAKLACPNSPNLSGGNRQALLLSETTSETTPKNLRPLTRPSSVSCGKSENRKAATPQQRRYAMVGRMTEVADAMLNKNPNLRDADLADELKQWAASNGIRYFDACPGAATPIQQAITNACARRRKTA